MDSDGMEALLDFPEFVDVPSEPPPTGETSAGNESENTASLEASTSESPETVPNTSSETSKEEADKSKSTAEKNEGSSVEPPPRKKRKHHSGSSADTGPSSRPSGSGVTDEERPERHDDDSAPGSPSDQDFESDFLDLMPFKEEDPEDVAERQKLQLLISHLSEEQLNRYEVYRRASFPKASVRRIIQTVSGCTVSQNAVIAMAGIAKMHVGEIVEQALDVKEQWGDVGPVQPKHLREVLRQLRNRPSTTSSKFRKKQSQSGGL